MLHFRFNLEPPNRYGTCPFQSEAQSLANPFNGDPLEVEVVTCRKLAFGWFPLRIYPCLERNVYPLSSG